MNAHPAAPARSWRSAARAAQQFLFSRPEGDPRFREEIERSCRRSIRTCCALAAAVLLSYLFLAVVIQGRTPAWIDGRLPNVSFLDKLIALSVVTLGYGSSFRAIGLRHARFVVGAGIILIGIVETTFDLLQLGSAAFVTPWLALFLFVGLGTMPFRFTHALVLGVAMFAVYPLVFAIAPGLFSLPPASVDPSQVTFMSIMIFLGAILSGVLYRNRYESFLQRSLIQEARDSLSTQADRLLELDRIKARFFANLSHEFRTPLTLMLGPVEDALAGRSGALPPRLGPQLDIARRSGHRLRELIDQLLDLSRIDAGGMVLEAASYDMVSFVRTLVSSFFTLAETRQVELSFQSTLSGLQAVFDADKMEKIVENLLSNALKFTPAGGKVRVLVTEEDTFAVVAVKDTGQGIPVEELPFVFDRFYQTGTHRSDIQSGTGIGLALVKELTELHGGNVELASEPGFGSEFRIRIPVAVAIREAGVTGAIGSENSRGASAAEGIIADRAEWENGQGGAHGDPIADPDATGDAEAVADSDEQASETVSPDAPLVVIADDNADVRTYLRSQIETRYRVREASDGAEALRLIEEETPALVLSDVMMPVLDGHELCRRIKSEQRTSHVPVVLMTARASDESRREGLEVGADDYLFKPFNAGDILIRVENLIEIRRVLRERFSGEYVIRTTDVEVKSADVAFLERLRTIIEEHIGDSNFGVDWLAWEAGISSRQLQRRIRTSVGLSANGFIRTLRLERAARLLEARAGTVSEIAYRVGFQDANYFSRLFRQTFGLPPSEYAHADEGSSGR